MVIVEVASVGEVRGRAGRAGLSVLSRAGSRARGGADAVVAVGDVDGLGAVWADGHADAVVGVGDDNRLGLGEDLTGGHSDRAEWDAKSGVLNVGGGGGAGGLGGGGGGGGGDGPGENCGSCGRGGDEASQLAAGDSDVGGHGGRDAHRGSPLVGVTATAATIRSTGRPTRRLTSMTAAGDGASNLQ